MKPTSAITYADDATAGRKRKPHLKMSESDDEDYFDPPAKKSRKSTASELNSAVGSNSATPGLVNVKVETDTDTDDAWSAPYGQFPSTSSQPTWSLFENSEDRKMQQYNTAIKKLEKTYDVYASRKNWGLLLDIHSQIHKEVKLMNREGEGDEEKLMVAPKQKQKKTVESAYTSLLEKIEELYKLETHLIESLSLKMDEEPSFAEHIIKKLDECIRNDLNKTMLAMAKESSVTVSEQCNKEGCTNQAQKGGVMRHGAKKKKLCSSEGCTKQAQNRGVCIKHGAKRKLCSNEGCTNKAVKGGVCIRHGAKKV